MSAASWYCPRCNLDKPYIEGKHDRGCPQCGETMILDDPEWNDRQCEGKWEPKGEKE